MEDAHVKLSVQCWRRCTRETQQIPIKLSKFPLNRGNKLQLFPTPGWKKVIQMLTSNKLPTKDLIVFRVKPNQILKYHFKFLCQTCQETTYLNITVFFFLLLNNNIVCIMCGIKKKSINIPLSSPLRNSKNVYIAYYIPGTILGAFHSLTHLTFMTAQIEKYSSWCVLDPESSLTSYLPL